MDQNSLDECAIPSHSGMSDVSQASFQTDTPLQWFRMLSQRKRPMFGANGYLFYICKEIAEGYVCRCSKYKTNHCPAKMVVERKKLPTDMDVLSYKAHNHARVYKTMPKQKIVKNFSQEQMNFKNCVGKETYNSNLTDLGKLSIGLLGYRRQVHFMDDDLTSLIRVYDKNDQLYFQFSLQFGDSEEFVASEVVAEVFKRFNGQIKVADIAHVRLDYGGFGRILEFDENLPCDGYESVDVVIDFQNKHPVYIFDEKSQLHSVALLPSQSKYPKELAQTVLKQLEAEEARLILCCGFKDGNFVNLQNVENGVLVLLCNFSFNKQQVLDENLRIEFRTKFLSEGGDFLRKLLQKRPTPRPSKAQVALRFVDGERNLLQNVNYEFDPNNCPTLGNLLDYGCAMYEGGIERREIESVRCFHGEECNVYRHDHRTLIPEATYQVLVWTEQDQFVLTQRNAGFTDRHQTLNRLMHNTVQDSSGRNSADLDVIIIDEESSTDVVLNSANDKALVDVVLHDVEYPCIIFDQNNDFVKEIKVNDRCIPKFLAIFISNQLQIYEDHVISMETYENGRIVSMDTVKQLSGPVFVQVYMGNKRLIRPNDPLPRHLTDLKMADILKTQSDSLNFRLLRKLKFGITLNDDEVWVISTAVCDHLFKFYLKKELNSAHRTDFFKQLVQPYKNSTFTQFTTGRPGVNPNSGKPSVPLSEASQQAWKLHLKRRHNFIKRTLATIRLNGKAVSKFSSLFLLSFQCLSFLSNDGDSLERNLDEQPVETTHCGEKQDVKVEGNQVNGDEYVKQVIDQLVHQVQTADDLILGKVQFNDSASLPDVLQTQSPSSEKSTEPEAVPLQQVQDAQTALPDIPLEKVDQPQAKLEEIQKPKVFGNVPRARKSARPRVEQVRKPEESSCQPVEKSKDQDGQVQKSKSHDKPIEKTKDSSELLRSISEASDHLQSKKPKVHDDQHKLKDIDGHVQKLAEDDGHVKKSKDRTALPNEIPKVLAKKPKDHDSLPIQKLPKHDHDHVDSSRKKSKSKKHKASKKRKHEHHHGDEHEHVPTKKIKPSCSQPKVPTENNILAPPLVIPNLPTSLKRTIEGLVNQQQVGQGQQVGKRSEEATNSDSAPEDPVQAAAKVPKIGANGAKDQETEADLKKLAALHEEINKLYAEALETAERLRQKREMESQNQD